MLIKISLLLSFLCLASCGDSPFLNKNKGEEKLAVSNTQALSSALSLKNEAYKIQYYWRVGPVVFDESKLLMVVTDKQGVPVEPKENLEVMIWMPTMGHGSSPTTVTKVGVGLYEVSEIYFIMEGYWDIHFQLYSENKIIDQISTGLTL